MLQSALKLVGFDLQQQLAKLRAEAEDFKDRTTAEVKRQAADIGITIGLAFVGVFLVFVTMIVGVVALYLWIATLKGPFVALGAVGLTTAILAGLLFTIAATRGGKEEPKRRPAMPIPSSPAPERVAAASASSAAARSYAPSPAVSATPAPSALDSLTRQFTVDALSRSFPQRGAGVTTEALDSATEIVRKGPREAVLATLAAAAMVGVVLGRRR